MTARETCPLCRDGHPRSFGEHFRLSERGRELLAPCSVPDQDPEQSRHDFPERFAAFRERLQRMLHPKPMPMPVAARGGDEEDDES